MIVAVEVPEQGNQFIAFNEYPGWIGDQQLAERFVAGIVGPVAKGYRLCWGLANAEVNFKFLALGLFLF